MRIVSGKMFTRADEQLATIPTPEEFTRVVDTLVSRYRISYFEAILELCEQYERDYESVKPLMTSKLKVALMEELSAKRLLKDKHYLTQRLG